MSEKPPEFIRKAFPRTWYYPKWKLLGWYPCGVLNPAFADQVIEFIEMEERIQDAPFDRYADLSGLTHIRSRTNHIFQTARRPATGEAAGQIRILRRPADQFQHRAHV